MIINYSKFKLGKISSKSDVWSYGVTVWEIFTHGKTPFPGISNPEVKKCLKRGERLCKPDNCPSLLYENLLKVCWFEDPDVRPDFNKILEIIDNFIQMHHEN